MTDQTQANEEPLLHRPKPNQAAAAAAATLVLIALGDFLTFDQTPGLNLFICTPAVAGGILILGPARWPLHRTILASLLSILTALPLLEAPGIIAILLALLGLATLALARFELLPEQLTALPATLFRFALSAPLRLIEDGMGNFAKGREIPLTRAMSRGFIVWTVPLLVALIFIALFWSANPVIADVIGKFDASLLLRFFDFWRLFSWAVMAALLWPLLRPRLPARRAAPAIAAVAEGVSRENLIFGAAAILRSLLLFNALFAVQTALDLTYLWAGAKLPDGMTHAEYAHRGAYPLIATALLAAAFVLAAMRRNGPGEHSRPIRLLVYLWIAQNILLCASSIFRLELYVEISSLTEWRIAAGIWMALVASGLALILLRIVFRRSNEWLVAMNLATLAAVLYCCAFTDFSAIIADFNIAHSGRLSAGGTTPDIYYLRQLGPSAIPALDRYIAAPGGDDDGANDDDPKQVRRDLAAAFGQRSRDWRSWNFRDWRLDRYLQQHGPVASTPPTAND